ncbi:hypothetical protein FRC09_019071 [Ceratobasidium sp. 395]|nr:hypothetical protein FRC09_019071 [Ceratobasidium sp. 395]
MDDEFLDAYFNGVKIKCADGITRRVFPRILTYLADYPKKVLIAAIRNGGGCLCPCCLVKKSSASMVGTSRNANIRVVKRRIGGKRYKKQIGKARNLVLKLGRLVQSKAVKALLKGESYVPTLDVASMSRMAARDFEDILQCCIAVFKGLLPPICEEPARTLIFLFASWHGLAKSQLHTKVTLKMLESLKSKLGLTLQNFAKLTESLDVRETPQEYARWQKQYKSSKAKSSAKGKQVTKKAASEGGNGRRRCVLNLNTYKTHSMGDYVPNIEEFGTTDSYSTQIGKLTIQRIKAQYKQTNWRNEVEQMTRISDICMVLEDIDTELKQLAEPADTVSKGNADLESLFSGDPYSIGQRD